MNISQEILVLDFGDGQSTDFLRSDKPGGIASEANFGGKYFINNRNFLDIRYLLQSLLIAGDFSDDLSVL